MDINKTRLDWIDFGKGISMFLVILYHSEEYFPMSPNAYSELFKFFRMPFFFFLSGYLFTSNYHEFSLKKKMLQIFRGIVWTYIIFTTIIFIPKSIAHGYSLYVGFKEILLGWASWFVIALGGAQIIFSFILCKIKNIRLIITCIIGALILGYIIKLIHPQRLPYQLDKTFLVMFFFGLGFLYRLYENKIDRFIRIKLKNMILLMLCYFTLYFIDVRYIHTTQSVIQSTTYNYFLLSIFYSLLGIYMMIFFVKIIHPNKYLCFMGKNSLVFYYLNGGGNFDIEYFIQQNWYSDTTIHRVPININYGIDCLVHNRHYCKVYQTLLSYYNRR